jgi:hypothetical protein
MPYQCHNFHTTGVDALKLWLVQVETCTDMSLLQSSCMTPFKSCNKIHPGTSQPYHMIHCLSSPNLCDRWCCRQFLTSFSTFRVNVDVAMCKTATKCSYVICTFKSDLINFILENVCSQLYVGTTIDNMFSKPLKLMYLESENSKKKKKRHSSQNWTSFLVLYHSTNQSVPAKDYLKPFQYQRTKDKSKGEFLFSFLLEFFKSSTEFVT